MSVHSVFRWDGGGSATRWLLGSGVAEKLRGDPTVGHP